MRKSIIVAVLLAIIFSCKKEDLTPVTESIEFSMTAYDNSFETGDAASVSILRSGNYDFETDADVYFYISKDAVYSSDDIQLTTPDSKYPAVFTQGQAAVISVNIDLEIIQSGQYYLIAKLKPQTGTSVRFCSVPVTITVPKAGVVFTDISFSAVSANGTDTTTSFDLNSSAYAKMGYTTSLSSSTYFSYTLYLSNDNVLDEGSDKVMYSDAKYLDPSYSTGSASGTLSFAPQYSYTITEGTYYVIAKGYYNNKNGKSVSTNTVSKKIVVKKFADLISIAGISLSKSSYLNNEIAAAVVTITNGSIDTREVSLKLYISLDRVIDYYDTEQAEQSGITIKPGKNVVTISSSISSSLDPAYYYLLPLSTYSNASIAYTSSSAGVSFQVVPAQITISGATLSSPHVTLDLGQSFTFTVFTESNILVSFNQSFYMDIYLSDDGGWSEDDTYVGAKSINYTHGELATTANCTIPVVATNGDKYIILRYIKPGTTNYQTYVVSGKLTIQSASAILFRNTSNTTYPTMYLFVDEVYVKTLDCFSSFTAPTCVSFSSATCSYYSSGSTFYYKFYGSDGTHTYKICTTNNLATGTVLFTNTFNADHSTCVAVDVDQ